MPWTRTPQWRTDENGVWRIEHQGVAAEVMADGRGWHFRYIDESGEVAECGGPYESRRIATSRALDNICPF